MDMRMDKTWTDGHGHGHGQDMDRLILARRGQRTT
jgi:hypothetical protein